MSIEEELLDIKNKKELKVALELGTKMDKIKEKTLFRFFENIQFHFEENNYRDITNFIENKELVVDDSKCRDRFKLSKNRPTNFGVFFDCQLGNDLYLHVQLATRYMYYGICKMSQKNNGYKLEEMVEGEFKPGEYRNFKKIKFYAYRYIDIEKNPEKLVDTDEILTLLYEYIGKIKDK